MHSLRRAGRMIIVSGSFALVAFLGVGREAQAGIRRYLYVYNSLNEKIKVRVVNSDGVVSRFEVFPRTTNNIFVGDDGEGVTSIRAYEMTGTTIAEIDVASADDYSWSIP